MKKISFFIVLALLSSNLEAGRLADCNAWCKKVYDGKLYDKSTDRGVCARGCSSSHWIGTKKAKQKCWKRDFGVAVCLAGARNY